MISLDGTSLFIIMTVIVLLVMGLFISMPKVDKTRIAGKLRQRYSRKKVLDIPMEEDHIFNLIKTKRVNQNQNDINYGEYAEANRVKNTGMFF